jgi:beta-ring hydroxylase
VQIDAVVGDRRPGAEEVRALRLTTRVVSEALRLYPQPPVLIRRALAADTLGGFSVAPGSDIFISVWNIHRRAGQQLCPCAAHTCKQDCCHNACLPGCRNPEYWQQADDFNPDRFPLDGPIPNEVTEAFNYLPFGGGKRKCIGALALLGLRLMDARTSLGKRLKHALIVPAGDQFALVESIVTLAILLRRFEFSMAPDAPAVGMTTVCLFEPTKTIIHPAC